MKNSWIYRNDNKGRQNLEKKYQTSLKHVEEPTHEFKDHENYQIQNSLLQHFNKTQTIIPANTCQQKYKSLLPRRKKQSIEILKIKTMKKYRRAKRGCNRQTTNLSKYVYCKIMSFLQIIFVTNQLTPSLKEVVKQFKKQRGELNSYKKLFQHDIFLDTYRQNFEASAFVSTILRSSRMKMKSKLTFIKFLERIRLICIESKGRWKQKDPMNQKQTN